MKKSKAMKKPRTPTPAACRKAYWELAVQGIERIVDDLEHDITHSQRRVEYQESLLRHGEFTDKWQVYVEQRRCRELTRELDDLKAQLAKANAALVYARAMAKPRKKR